MKIVVVECGFPHDIVSGCIRIVQTVNRQRKYLGWIAVALFLLTSTQAKALPQNRSAIAQTESDSYSSHGFFMPSKNIYCVVYGDRLRCEIRSLLSPMPPHLGSCNWDWGHGLVLFKKGKATVLCAGDTAYSPNFPVLAYGKTWSKAGYICKSRTDGLTCTNSTGNGFFLNREEWKIF